MKIRTEYEVEREGVYRRMEQGISIMDEVFMQHLYLPNGILVRNTYLPWMDMELLDLLLHRLSTLETKLDHLEDEIQHLKQDHVRMEEAKATYGRIWAWVSMGAIGVAWLWEHLRELILRK